MNETPPASDPNGIAAGDFGAWLTRFRASLLGNEGSDVPCGECRGCCVSGYSVQIRPHDAGARWRIPPELLASAPGFARGELTMAARPDGTCPMLRDGECSIYPDRPQTCRDYDCRIFAAAGLEAGSADKAVINRRVRQWRFTYPTEADRKTHEAVRAAAAFIRNKRSRFPGQRAPASPTGVAVLAIESYRVFLEAGIETRDDTELARAILAASREFRQPR